MSTIHKSYVVINQAHLYYESQGQGTRLIFLNGGDLDCRMWDDQFSVFSKSYRVLRYDGRGYGQTTLERDVPFRHIDDLSALMDSLEIETAILVGVSLGAGIALDFTLEYPQRVQKLVLASPSLGGYEFTSEQFQAYMQAFDAAFEADDIDHAIEVSLRMWVDGWTRPTSEVDPDVRARVKEMTAHAYAMPEPPEPLPLDPPAIERLAEVQKRVLIITGEEDIPDSHAIAKILIKGIAGATGASIPAAAHYPNLEQPALFNRAVLDFLQAS